MNFVRWNFGNFSFGKACSNNIFFSNPDLHKHKVYTQFTL